MSPVQEELMAYWYRALHSEYGIEIACSDAEQVRQKLYAVRREAKDTELDGIALCISPFDAQRVWLVKKGKPPNETP